MVNVKKLALFASIAVAMSANAASLDRYYNNGGLMFSIDGAVSPTLSKRVSKFSYVYSDPRAFDRFQFDSRGNVVGFSQGTLEQALLAKDEQRTDERLRLNGLNDSYINLGVNQSLSRKSGLYGSLGLYHTPATGQLITGDAVFYHMDYGELIFSGNGALPTSEVATSGTYNLLDTRAGGVVAGAYRYIPKLTLQGYYSFADLPDGNPLATGLQRGYGATASYNHSFAPRNNLRLNLGYSKGERRKDLAINTAPRDKQSMMAGLSYNYYNWTVAVDGGVSESNYHGNLIDKTKTTAQGVRVTYAFTPRFSTHAFYGERDTTSTEADGVTLDFNRLHRTAFMEGRLPVVNETQLFKNIKENTYGVGVRYNYHRNVSFSGNVSESNTKYSLTDGDFAKLKNQNYNVGVTLSF